MSDRPERRWKWSRRRVRRATLAEGISENFAETTAAAGSHALERAALRLCEELGAPAFHDADSRRNPSGLPDLVAVVGSTLVLAEFKPEGRYPDPAQRRWLEALAGVTHLWSGVVRPADWPTFAATLEALAQQRGGDRHG